MPTTTYILNQLTPEEKIRLIKRNEIIAQVSAFAISFLLTLGFALSIHYLDQATDDASDPNWEKSNSDSHVPLLIIFTVICSYLINRGVMYVFNKKIENDKKYIGTTTETQVLAPTIQEDYGSTVIEVPYVSQETPLQNSFAK